MEFAPAIHPLDVGKTAEQLFAERNQRMLDAMTCKQPDRIPLLMGMGYYLAEMAGATRQELYDHPEKQQEMLEKAALMYQPDNIMGYWHTPELSRALGDRMTKWPGLGLGPNGSFQFNEQEFMKPQDYDDFIDDPADWAIRVYTPRAFQNCEGFGLLPPLGTFAFGYYNGLLNYPGLADPAIVSAFAAMYKAVQEAAKWFGYAVIDSGQRLAALGFPPCGLLANMVEAPFDFMSDTLRGMRGIFLDMLRIPDKLLAAEQKVSRFEMKHLLRSFKANHVPFCFIPLHRGSDGFMSLPQFEKFYWPQLRDMMLEMIDNGITPICFYEGVWDQRLKYLAELPQGKTAGIFQDSNIFKVKEAVGTGMSIIGGMPIPLLKNGTPESVREHTRKVCREVGKGGSFVMCTTVLDLEGCNPELIKAWVDATKEFGGY